MAFLFVRQLQSNKRWMTMSNNIKIRESISSDAKVKELLENINMGNPVLANVFGIQGMGKDFFLNDFFIPLLESKNILHFKSGTSISMETMLSQSKQIAIWLYSDILGKNKNIKKDLNSTDELEKIYLDLRKDLKEEKSRKTFAILVNDVSNLPFDDLDWFQSVVLDTISSSPSSIIVVTSQNELNWHSWEMRNKCLSIKLPVFTQEELIDLCESPILAEKVYELSAGHPAAAVSLIEAAKNNINTNLALITKEDIEKNNSLFYEHLEGEINSNLNFKGREWLKEVFKLTSIADGFDADLVSDIVHAFQDTKFKDYKKTLDEINDIAWEMANTGLAEWDFDEKTYRVLPELRERILKYMKYKHQVDYSKALEIIANSYLLRAEILPNKAKQIVNFMFYFSKSKLIENTSSVEIVNLINNKLEKVLTSSEDYIQLKKEIHNRNIEKSTIKNILYSFTNFEETQPIISSLDKGDAVMNNATPSAFKVSKSSMSRKEVKDLFGKFIKGEVEKRIMHIEGEGGIGKTHLLRILKEHVKNQSQLLIQIDLHNPEYRNATSILREIAKQSGILTNKKILDAFVSLEKEIRDIGKGQPLFAAGSLTEQFDKPYSKTIIDIKEVLLELSLHPVIFIDTVDNHVLELTKWFFPNLINGLKEVVYFVLAGRLELREFDKFEGNLGFIPITLSSLNEQEIQELRKDFKHRGQSKKIRDDIFNSIAKISDGNPLALLWILFYLMEFEREDDWLKFVSQTKEQIFSHIADRFLLDADETLNTVDRAAGVIALKAAINFGAHFNLEVFTKSVPANQLGSIKHEKIYREMQENFFYIRGTDERNYWTLHDKVREWLLDSYINTHPISVPRELKHYSDNAIKFYYEPEIERMRNIENRSAEQQDKLENLKIQQIYHRVWIETRHEPEFRDIPLKHHRDLWNYLDYLWDHYRHYQMSQVIKYCEELYRWSFIKSDLLLKDILNAAQAWLYYSQTEYEDAQKYANQVRKVSPHRRLRGTVNVVLGLIPTSDPDEAFSSLETAKGLYEELIRELRTRHISSDDKFEFTDDLDKIYPELHLVLVSIGRTHLRYFVDLEKGIESLDQANKNSKRPEWKRPLYSAVVLNEWARILRFQGEYSEALNKVMNAIFIYKRKLSNPQQDANFGYFYETLGLIYKELSLFDYALKAFETAASIYKNIENILDSRKATITLEIGHIYLLQKQYETAKDYLHNAYNVFKNSVAKNPWYYLNSLNKLGEYYFVTGKLEEAKKYFYEQKKLSEQYNHHLWKYWAELFMAEIDFEDKEPFDTKNLENLLTSSINQGFEFGPAFWRTKHLLYKLSKNKEDEPSVAITHLTEGLTYLSEHWRALFWQNLVLLRNELLELEPKKLDSEIDRIVSLWKLHAPESNSSHPFLQMCETLRESL